MVLLLRSLFISLTLVVLPLTDILILHAFNAKKPFYQEATDVYQRQHPEAATCYVACALCIGSLQYAWAGR